MTSSTLETSTSTPTATRGRLVLREVSKTFRNSTMAAIDRVSITCAPGAFVVVVGPRGSGKSTLLSLAAGLIGPDSGEVTLDGRPVAGPGPERAMVFQEHGLFPWLSA